MKIRINVTKEVLEKSKMCGHVSGMIFSIHNCAIAVAVREIFPHASVVRYIEPFGFTSDSNISLPDKALNFIDDFDFSTPYERVLMTPISFEIDVPDSVIERIGLQEVETILSKSVNLERV